MKATVSKYLEILIESVNYIIINYALSNMAMLFRSNPLFILFFASEIWMFGNYWKKMDRLTANKAISSILLIVCFLLLSFNGASVLGIFVGIVYGILRFLLLHTRSFASLLHVIFIEDFLHLFLEHSFILHNLCILLF